MLCVCVCVYVSDETHREAIFYRFFLHAFLIKNNHPNLSLLSVCLSFCCFSGKKVLFFAFWTLHIFKQTHSRSNKLLTNVLLLLLLLLLTRKEEEDEEKEEEYDYYQKRAMHTMDAAVGTTSHKAPRSGAKAKKKKDAKSKKKSGGVMREKQKGQNAKAFIFSSSKKAQKGRRVAAEKLEKKLHVPVHDRTTSEEPPPFVVVVQGPPSVGKTTLVRSLIRHYTKQTVNEIKGPITLTVGKKRRVQIIEVGQSLCDLIDAAKLADLVLLCVDGSYGFEMETFEFLNVLQVHGFPKVMGVLTHLDHFKEPKKLKKTKKVLKQRFWTEIYDGAKLFYISGMTHGRYNQRDVVNLARFISVAKPRPLMFRSQHPYVIGDRFEDLTRPEMVHENEHIDREVAVFGWLHGCNMKADQLVHVAGVGDMKVKEITQLPDPCPLPSQDKRARRLDDRSKLIYAPMSDVGGLLYDKDAVYVSLDDRKVNYTNKSEHFGDAKGNTIGYLGDDRSDDEDNNDIGKGKMSGVKMVKGLQSTQSGFDEKLKNSEISLFGGGAKTTGEEDIFDRKIDDDDDDDDDNDNDNDEDDAEENEQKGGRVRRRAVFNDGLTENEEDDEDDDDENEKEFSDADSDDDLGMGDDQDDDENEGLGAGANKWKAMLAKAGKRSKSLMELVYDDVENENPNNSKKNKNKKNRDDDNEDSDSDDLFKKTDDNQASRIIDAFDQTKFIHQMRGKLDVSDPALRNRFVTGDWDAAGARAEAQPLDESAMDDDEVYGDFEDLETGEKFAGKDSKKAGYDDEGSDGSSDEDGSDSDSEGDDSDDDSSGSSDSDEDEEAKEKRRLAKIEKHEEFQHPSAQGRGARRKQKGLKGPNHDTYAEDEPTTYFDLVKDQFAEQTARTRAALDALPASTREAMEGFRPGAYLRVVLESAPCEWVKNFDPKRPILVGGLLAGENVVGMQQLRLKRHRWHRKTLKNKDPLIFSIGWRRFQTIPVYSVVDANSRHRMIKYTPEHMHCNATIHGPIVPPNTAAICFQKINSNQSSFRVAATAVVIEVDHSMKIMKKLKLVGTPHKIYKNTAFITGMFNSSLEVAKFEGAMLRTVSGIRGTVKKAVKPGQGEHGSKDGGLGDGACRCTFEDKLLMSDIVFLRSWVRVEVPRFYNPVMNALVKSDDDWIGMRTVGQIRYDNQMTIPVNPDSIYKPIERKKRVFNKLQIPKALQQALPFKSKPKLEPSRKRKTLEQKRAVVQDKEEKKMTTMVQQLNTIRNEKMAKRKAQQDVRRAVKAKKDAKDNEWRSVLEKERKKSKYREEGKAEKLRALRAQTS